MSSSLCASPDTPGVLQVGLAASWVQSLCAALKRRRLFSEMVHKVLP